MTWQVYRYQTIERKQPFTEWVGSFKDRNIRTLIRTRTVRLSRGNFGDYKMIGEGVFESRIHFGPGYRIYFGIDGEKLIILLCGGEKSTQASDIRQAQNYWRDYLRRRS